MLHKLDQLHLDVIIAERFPDYGLGRTITASKGQQQNKITLKTAIITMNFDLLLENITNPALLFFLLGIIAVRLKVI
jgi:hypothetical protein